MKSIYSILAILIIITAFSLAIFAQSSDDNDGDGVKNSEDACPDVKGTKANKGCPGEDKELTPEEAKKQKEKLDSLKSNITFDSTPSPSPTPSKANALLAPDCKFILDFEKCRNILFVMSRDEIVKQFGTPTIQKYDMSSYYFYKGLKIDVANADFVYGVEFNGFAWDDDKLKSPLTAMLPAQDIKWGDGKDKILKRFGNINPQKIKGVNGEKFEIYYYDDKHLKFELTNGKLTKIEITRKVSDDEYARNTQIYRQKQAEIEAQKSPEQRAKEKAYEAARPILDAFESLHERVEYYSNKANKLVEEFNKQQGVYESLGWRSRKEQEITQVRGEGIKLIEQFLEKYKGKLPQEMIDHLNGDIEKLRSGGKH